MNQNLTNIIEETDTFCTKRGTHNRETWDTKFAELIIRKCSDIALREEHDPSDCILTHFGLKRVND